MKDKLIHDIELKLAISCPGMDRERILQCVISCLNDYDVTAREGKSLQEIMEAAGCSEPTARKYMKEALDEK